MPIQYAWDRHARLSVIAALAYRPRSGRLSLSFSIQGHNVKATDFLEFLLQPRRELRRPIILVCDRLNVHGSAIRQLHERGTDWLTVEWLPPYAPDLNRSKPSGIQIRRPAQPCPEDTYELCDLVAESLNDQHFRPPLLQSFFRRAKLPIKAERRGNGHGSMRSAPSAPSQRER
jgi:hypothetical protein